MDQTENKLRDEILEDAHKKADRSLKRAQREATRALNEAQKAEAGKREDALAGAELEAEEKQRAILSTIAQEIRRRWLLMREETMEELLQQALASVLRREGFGVDESRKNLLEEAIATIGEGKLRLRVMPAELQDYEKIIAGYCAGERIFIEADPKISGGLILETEDGRMRFDNTYATRLERLRAPLRSLLTETANQ